LKNAGLEPASPAEFITQVGSCLALVVWNWIRESDRAEWLRVAEITLAEIPADLLARGCDKARRTCQFPSQIVPCIFAEIDIAMDLRRGRVRHEPQSFTPPPKLPDPEYVDPAEVRALIAKIGNA
jgi:hypothetical protein